MPSEKLHVALAQLIFTVCMQCIGAMSNDLPFCIIPLRQTSKEIITAVYSVENRFFF